MVFVLSLLKRSSTEVLSWGNTSQKKEEELSKKIFTDQEYDEIVGNTKLHDKIKRIILKHGPFTGPEIDVFVEENLNRPVLEEIFNDFKGNEGIRNARKKYGVTKIHPINENLIEQK